MPVIIQKEETRPVRSGQGWVETILAGREWIGEPVISARRWSLEPGAGGPQIEHGDFDELVYVISGSGIAVVGDSQLPLEPESVLWLEPGDRYSFKAGPGGLEVLQACAPEHYG